MAKNCFQCRIKCNEPSTREISKYASYHRGTCYYCQGRLSKELSLIEELELSLSEKELRVSREVARRTLNSINEEGKYGKKWWQFWK